MPDERLGWTKFTEADKGEFREGSDIWKALNSGFEVTIDPEGMTVNVWDPVNKKEIDKVYGTYRGEQAETYPMPGEQKPVEDQTLAENEEELKRLRADATEEVNSVHVIRTRAIVKIDRFSKLTQQIAKQKRPLGQGYLRRFFGKTIITRSRFIRDGSVNVDTSDPGYPQQPPSDK